MGGGRAGRGVGVSWAVADHAATADAGAVPDVVLAATARSVLDAVGVSLGASGIGEGCGPFLGLAGRFGGAGPCQVLGTRFRVGPAAAALANGALAHALDFEDAHDGALVHPHAAPVAAGLAIAEHLAGAGSPVTGRRFLAAVAVGADLVCRLGFLLTRVADEGGWYPPPIFGAVGAAVTAAKLLGLPPAGVLDAVSLATCQATCLGELKRSPRSVVRAVRDAFGAQGAVTAALLAADGVTGFDQPFEGDGGLVALYGRGGADPGRLLDGLGTTFHGAEVSFKPWPSCRGTHPFVAAALELRAELDGAEIRAVRARGGPVNAMLAEPRDQKVAPRTAIDAKFSLPFTVATALVRGRVDLGDFDAAARSDAAVLALAGRVTFEAEDRGGPGADWGELDVDLGSGATVGRAVRELPGSPGRPMDDAALVDKFVRCAALAAEPLAPAAAEAAAHRLLALADSGDAARALDLVPRATPATPSQ